MSLRIFSGATFLALAACGGPPDGVAPGNTQEIGSGTPAAPLGERIACAVGDAEYAEACTIERTPTAGGALVTIRQSDGGFRRLRVSADGKTVAAADGALPIDVIARSDAGTEIAIGDARYRLPPAR